MFASIIYIVFGTNFFSVQWRGDSYLSSFSVNGELLLSVATFYIIRHIAILFAI